jgi:hypothetical protein
MNGTYGFVYSGETGVGIGVFVIKDTVLTGADAGGGRYNGSVVIDANTQKVEFVFDQFVPAGTFLVQGVSAQEIEHTRQNIRVSLPHNFDDGKAINLEIPPGHVNIMIKRISEDYEGYAEGFSFLMQL